MQRCAAAVLLVCLFLIGCGGKDYDVVPVSGTVTLDGQPLAEATVMFLPVEGKTVNPGPPSVAVTAADGTYRLKTSDDDPGAVAGKHMVRIFTRRTEQADAGSDNPNVREIAPERVPERYNRNSELTFEVPAEGTDAADFQLTSK